MNLKRLMFLFLFIFFTSFICFSESLSAQQNNTYPQWAKDLRRTEIITLGSLPFVTLWTTLGYSLAVNGKMSNPLNKANSGYSTEEIKQIVGIALGISAVLGVTDLAINLISRKIKNDKENKKEKTVEIVPLSQQLLDFNSYELDFNESPQEDFFVFKNSEKLYMVRGIEDAVF